MITTGEKRQEKEIQVIFSNVDKMQYTLWRQAKTG